MSPNEVLPRGSFLRISTRLLLWLAGALGLGGLVRFFSHEPESGPPSSYDLGFRDNFLPDSKTVFPDIPAVLYRKGEEFLAYSLRCTHLGCTLADEGESFTCPCHGSQFSSEGQVLKGPSTENLPRLMVELTEEGRLILQMGGEGR
jgi:Rieske Fe-S protein